MTGDVAESLHALVPQLTQVLAWLDFAGVGVFAITGALVAARARQDIVTCAFFGVITGVGGGTMRDLLIGAPVFWIDDRGYLETCLVVSVLVFALPTERWPARTLTWLDALGLAVYCVIGTLKAMQYEVFAVAAAFMGAISASIGGVMRDVLAMRPSVLLTREFYISAAILGAGATAGLVAAGVSELYAGIAGGVLAFAARAGAISFDWTVPASRG